MFPRRKRCVCLDFDFRAHMPWQSYPRATCSHSWKPTLSAPRLLETIACLFRTLSALMCVPARNAEVWMFLPTSVGLNYHYSAVQERALLGRDKTMKDDLFRASLQDCLIITMKGISAGAFAQPKRSL